MLAFNLYDEKQLFIKIAEGDETAFRQIFDAYKKRLFVFVHRMVKSHVTAEELVQEIFLKLWSHRHALDKVENPNTYIFVIARNKTIDHLRKAANDKKMIGELWHLI